MNEPKEHKDWDLLNEIKEAFTRPAEHPAWPQFAAAYFPADEREQPEYLTTGQVLDRLNSMVVDEEITEKYIFNKMTEAGFKLLLPAPANVFLWMIKETPMKMIEGPVL